MKTVEDRLRIAASETREYAAKQWPSPPSRVLTPQRTSGWLAFVAAFAVVVVAFAALPWLMSMGRSDTAGQPDPLTTPTSTTTPTTAPASKCSAAGAPIPGDDDTLPAAVAGTRAAIVEAASRCDLQTVIDLAGPGFTTTFGGGDAESFRTWEEEGDGRLGSLLAILGMSNSVVDDGNGGEIYVWPSAFAYDTWEEIPPEALDELKKLYTADELEQFSRFGAYGGWRAGITESGDWLYFVAGD